MNQCLIDWKSCLLGEVYDVRDGTHDSPKYKPEGHALITSKNLKSDGLNFEKVKLIAKEDYLKTNERSAVHQGDVLFAMIGTIGNPVVVEVEPDFAIKNVALFKVPQEQNSYFLKYYLESEYVKSKMQSEAKGTTQKFVGLGYLRNFPILLPPLSEQKRIVAILEETFAGINQAVANAEKNLANARELFESYLKIAFIQKNEKWKAKCLGELCQIKPPKKEAKEKLSDTDLVSFVPMKKLGIRTKEIELNENRELKKVSGSYTYFADNDVLLAKITPCFENGKLGIARNLTNGIGFGSSEYIVFRIRGEIGHEYLYYYLSRDAFRDAGAKVMTGAVGHKRVPKEFIENLKIPFPSILEQQDIVKRLDKLQYKTQFLETIYKQKITALTELKQSILKKAFTGGLTADTVLKQANG